MPRTPDVPALHYDADGRGPALVLAHGFGGSARNWNGTARALRDRCTVVRYDARGHGRSDAPDDPAAYGPAQAVDDLRRVCDAAGAATAIVGGLSMGARTALAFAQAHPARTRGLVLAAIAAGRAGGGVARHALAFADAIEADGLDAAGARFVWGPQSGLDAPAARLVRQGFLEHPPHGLAHVLRAVVAGYGDVTAAAAALRALDVPTLVIVGADDAAALLPSRALAARLPRATLVEIPGAGHVVNLHQPAAFHAALRGWLDETGLG